MHRELFDDDEWEAATGGEAPPTPEEIAAACLSAQSGWSPEEMADRAGRPWGERTIHKVATGAMR